ncbi:hypothetical protein F443_20010 [Phytophthora nicotianae P1569]|uniref:DUF6818 domain-containing protein n=1 Tax=Phytophthora nicotianae P1569 TaxID=1317065 RepID=V9E453_PHYNI|nr:hypothetical protein F443_20010 [Phytophthora nicotianae P1569]
MSRCQTLHNGKQHNSIRYNGTRKRTTPETLYMLGLVEKILPFGSNLWNAVELQYYTKLRDGFPVCDAESIKRKFYALKNTRKPSGDPACPADVAQAKRVYRRIEGNCGVIVLDDAAPSVESSARSSAPSNRASQYEATSNAEEAQALQVQSQPASGRLSSTVSGEVNKRLLDVPIAEIFCTGKTAEELEQLGKELHTVSKDLLPESAKKRRRIDRLLENLESDDSADWCTAIIAMEERAAAREMDYRRELDAQLVGDFGTALGEICVSRSFQIADLWRDHIKFSITIQQLDRERMSNRQASRYFWIVLSKIE